MLEKIKKNQEDQLKIKENSENACLEESGSKFIKIRILVTRRVLKMDFSKLETLSRKRIQKFN